MGPEIGTCIGIDASVVWMSSSVHLIHAPKKTTYIITECIEINVTIKSEYLLHSESLTK
jgi:hypothetical protein